MHFGEGRFVLAGQRDAGRAVRLIADGQVESAQVAAGFEQFCLHLRYYFNRLIGGKDDRHPAVCVVVGLDLAQLAEDVLYIGRCGQRQVNDAGQVAVFVFCPFLGNFGVRADADSVDRLVRVGGPLAQRLAQQRDGGYQEQDKALTTGFMFGDAQGIEGLARPARHDELAPLRLFEMRVGAIQGFLLVRAQHLLRQPRRVAVNPLFQLRPVNRRFLEIVQVQAGDGRMLVLDRLRRVGTPVIGRRNPQAVGEACRAQRLVLEFSAGGRQERIDGRLIDGRALLIALALNGPVVAVDGECHQVDAGVRAAEVVPAGKLVPQPDLFEQVRVLGVGLQIGLHQPLKARALVLLGEGMFSVFFKDGVELHRSGAEVHLAAASVGDCAVLSFPQTEH